MYYTISGYKSCRNAVTNKRELKRFVRKIYCKNRQEARKLFYYQNPGSTISILRRSRYSKRRGKYV